MHIRHLSSFMARLLLFATVAANLMAATALSPEDKQRFSTAAIEFQAAQLNIRSLDDQYREQLKKLTDILEQRKAAYATLVKELQKSSGAEGCQLNASAEWQCPEESNDAATTSSPTAN